MTSLEQQLANHKGGKIIIWLNHPEFRMMNGVLVNIESQHIEVLVENRHVYLVPLQAIVAIREVSEA